MHVHAKYLLAAAITTLLVGAPIAIGAGEGQPLNGGARNPSGGATANYTRETQIIADTSRYGTRQSNKSDNGGGAIYGCRSKPGGTPAGNEPCLRATNLVNGLAFEYANNGGAAVGTITSSNPDAAPFTTNAKGVATGLNADQVDGQSATEIVSAAQAQNSRGQVSEGGVLSNARGITSATRTAAGTYTVVFAASQAACALGATVVDAVTPGNASIAPVDTTTFTVSTFAVGGGAAVDRAFHVTSVC